MLYNIIRFNIIMEWVKFNRIPNESPPITPAAPAAASVPGPDSPTLLTAEDLDDDDYVMVDNDNTDTVTGTVDGTADAVDDTVNDDGLGFDISLIVGLHKKVTLRASLVPFLGCQCLATNVAFIMKDYTRIEINAVDFLATDHTNGPDLERLPHGMTCIV